MIGKLAVARDAAVSPPVTRANSKHVLGLHSVHKSHAGFILLVQLVAVEQKMLRFQFVAPLKGREVFLSAKVIRTGTVLVHAPQFQRQMVDSAPSRTQSLAEAVPKNGQSRILRVLIEAQIRQPPSYDGVAGED